MRLCARGWRIWHKAMNEEKKACFVKSGRTEALVEFVSGALDPKLAAGVARHTSTCPACREFVAAQAAVWAALEADTVPAVSPDFDSVLYRKIAERESEVWWRRIWRSVTGPIATFDIRPVAAASLALALVVAAVFTRPPQSETEPAASQSAVFVNADLDTIEETLSDFEMLQVLGELPRSL
jgi:anti-sigma factor RsiW